MNKIAYSLRISLAAASLALAPCIASASLLTNYDLLGSSQSLVVWENLGNSNPTLAPTSGSGTIAVTSPGFVAGAGIYSFAGSYSVNLSKSEAFDIQTVVFQVQWAVDPALPLPFGGGARLSYNGGSQSLSATWSGQTTGVTSVFVPAIGANANYSVYTWQWDVSVVSGIDLGSITIALPLGSHSSLTAASIEVSDAANPQVFTAVPEPSAYGAMAICMLGVVVICRRIRRREFAA